MRRKLVWIAALALATGVTYAGDWHTGAQLQCTDCHTMHAQQSHNFGSAAGGLQTWVASPYLTKGPINALCLACHDGSSAADVVGAGNGGAANRSAGGLNTVAGTYGYDTWTGHTLDSPDDAPGDLTDNNYDPADTLHCTSCHQPHGYAGYNQLDGNGVAVSNAYRNLAGIAGFNVSYATGTNDPLVDVFQANAFTYETLDNNLNEANQAASGFGQWCSSCHGDFYGEVGDPEVLGNVATGHFIRHPSAGVDIGGIGGGHSNLGDFGSHNYRLRVMSASGDWGPVGAPWVDIPDPNDPNNNLYNVPDDLTPTCISCHKAHGNDNSFGLIYTDGTTNTEDGAGNYKTMCQHCHVQG